MLRKKISGVIVIFFLITVSGSFYFLGCYEDDNRARIVLHLERNDLAFYENFRNKRLIDKFLELFSTPAEAVTTNWLDNQGDLTLTVTSPDFADMEFLIPLGATEYSISIPVSDNVTFTVISRYNIPAVGIKKNWGGHITANVTSGENNLTVKMIPMTWLSLFPATIATIGISWEAIDPAPANASSYLIYRSTSSTGPFVHVLTVSSIFSNNTTNSGLVSGTVYYYRIAIQGSDGVGVMSDAVSLTAPN